MMSNENQWYPIKINDIQRESMISHENQWYPMKINDIQRKSLISDENQWCPTKINDVRRKSITRSKKKVSQQISQTSSLESYFRGAFNGINGALQTPNLAILFVLKNWTLFWQDARKELPTWCAPMSAVGNTDKRETAIYIYIYI